ncbi:MAG TPA: winged helix DNA-binding domain-containing protein [Glaciihabitans sp.]|jgi:hypothetical protein|nr:winged helix DNA-binding domain-containing protein [Glaciihabitans sp.]
MRHVSDHERRARIGVRHALAPSAAADSPEAATRAMTVLHATEPATVYLSCWARVPEVTVADIDRALFDERSLVKQLAMRRTLFVFPRDLLPAVLPSASARVAHTERTRMAKDVVLAELAEDGDEWLDSSRAGVLEHLATAPDGRTALELRQAVPGLDLMVERPGGNPWGASRVLIHLGLTGHVVRGSNTGHWRTSRPRWTLTESWLGADIRSVSSVEGYRELVRRWLYSFGPGTEEDIVWWLGATKSIVRAALTELCAVAVSLERDETGWLLPDDLDEVADPGPWVALLPVLDPTVMGWQGRTFYLGQHGAQVFEARGNAGTTAWVNGRVVGCWVQDAAGVVRVHLLENVSAAENEALNAEADRLTRWLAGERVGTGYVSPAMKAALLH